MCVRCLLSTCSCARVVHSETAEANMHEFTNSPKSKRKAPTLMCCGTGEAKCDAISQPSSYDHTLFPPVRSSIQSRMAEAGDDFLLFFSTLASGQVFLHVFNICFCTQSLFAFLYIFFRLFHVQCLPILPRITFELGEFRLLFAAPNDAALDMNCFTRICFVAAAAAAWAVVYHITRVYLYIFLARNMSTERL